MSNVLTTEPKKRSGQRITIRAVYDELNRLRQRVEDLEDLRELNDAILRNRGKRLIPWNEAKKGLEFGD
ncbi:hypothetical protein SBV1_130116 [Verrucomicrobia bacterium]|nr:hypothetical protein SBV1_130116 [Verrucomicrobiota bacterium]